MVAKTNLNNFTGTAAERPAVIDSIPGQTYENTTTGLFEEFRGFGWEDMNPVLSNKFVIGAYVGIGNDDRVITHSVGGTLIRMSIAPTTSTVLTRLNWFFGPTTYDDGGVQKTVQPFGGITTFGDPNFADFTVGSAGGFNNIGISYSWIVERA